MKIKNKENFNQNSFLEREDIYFRNQFEINSNSDFNSLGNEKYDKYY